MEQMQLIGSNNWIEMQNISGKGISFKKISIPGEDCSNFLIRYEIKNDVENLSSPIICRVSPYQRDVSQVTLHKALVIPDNSTFRFRIESLTKLHFTGKVFIDYEIFIPAIVKDSDMGMNVNISESDRQKAFRAALSNLASFFKIPQWEFEDNQSLYDKIKVLDHPIVKNLQAYFIAYDEWFKFYARIKKLEIETGIYHEFTDDELNELYKLKQNRENTFKKLKTKFETLEFDEYKKSRGLEIANGLEL